MSKRPAKPQFTIEALSQELDRRGITVKLNVISNCIEYDGIENNPRIPRISPEYALNSLPIVLYDDMRQVYSNCTRADVKSFLGVIAAINHYNPVWDMITESPWDGIDHFSEMVNALGIDDDFSILLIRKWLRQGLALLNNDYKSPYGADGMLCLQGRQGIGKTSFFSWVSMSPRFFREGQRINVYDKDTIRRILTCFIAELGELDATFKTADPGFLKEFISNKFDAYRLPYGDSDEQIPRHTSLGATVNDVKFLIDQTGSRRFWAIPVDKIDLDALHQIPAVQVWRQVLAQDDMLNNLQSFRLTESERATLERRNRYHDKALPGEDEILDILDNVDDNTQYAPLMASQWIALYPSLARYNAIQVGAVLNKLGIDPINKKQTRVDGKKGTYRMLPLP